MMSVVFSNDWDEFYAFYRKYKYEARRVKDDKDFEAMNHLQSLRAHFSEPEVSTCVPELSTCVPEVST